LYIPEADFEYLIRTLSDARSRATELAISIGSRLGTEHRLTQLANTAASSIESTLRAIRNAAAQKQDSGAGVVAQSQTIHAPLLSVYTFAVQAGLDAEHWLPVFVDELLARSHASRGITFENAEGLLQQHKDKFLRDFLTARRMYRAYPGLFPEIADEAAKP
jgi:hypothetical protein